MEPKYYQFLEFELARECKGARYHNLWYINQKGRLIDCTIQLYLYWDVLHLAAEKVLCLYEEVATNYWQVSSFVMRLHAIHIQARRNKEK